MNWIEEIPLNGDTPIATVTLPLFNARRVAWLALESLARQRCIDAGSWQLLACEEESGHDRLGPDALAEYGDALRAAGCSGITYISIPEWIKLSAKYILMSEYLKPSVKMVVIQGADNYAQPLRLAEAMAIMTGIVGGSPIDLMHQPCATYYNLLTGQLHTWDTSKYQGRMGRGTRTGGIDMTFSARLFRRLHDQEPHPRVAGNDSWLLAQLERVKGRPLHIYENPTRHWDKGIFTRGMNNLSRRSYGDEAHFTQDYRRLESFLPDEIAERLEALALEAQTGQVHDLISNQNQPEVTPDINLKSKAPPPCFS